MKIVRLWGKKFPRRRGQVGWKQCSGEIGARPGQPGLLRVFVFNISIHVGRDTIAVVLSVRVPWCVSLPRSSASPLSQIARPGTAGGELGMVSGEITHCTGA